MVNATGAGGEQKIAYTSAAFNVSATGIKVTGFATGANLVAWPRDITLPSAHATDMPLKFVASGDSKTTSNGWQPTLLTSLNAAASPLWLSSANFALATYTAAELQALIAVSVPAAVYSVNYVLLNIGINDVIDGTTEATFKAAYLACLDIFNARLPNAVVYCMRVWGRGYGAEYTALNSWINDCIALRSFAFAGPDETVWLEGGDDGATMTSDGIHYSAAGNAEAAAQWKTVLGY